MRSELLKTLTETPHLIKRADLQLIEKSLKNGWDIPQDIIDVLPMACDRIIRNHHLRRARTRACEIRMILHKKFTPDAELPAAVGDYLTRGAERIEITDELIDEWIEKIDSNIGAL